MRNSFFYVVNRGATRSVVSFRRGAARSIAPIDGLKRTSTGTRTLVYRVKACRDNHLHYREPLDEIIAAIVCSLRMIGNVMLPPIAHINSCAVCIGNSCRDSNARGVYHRVDVGFVSESYGCAVASSMATDRARFRFLPTSVVTRRSDDDETDDDDAEETRAR